MEAADHVSGSSDSQAAKRQLRVDFDSESRVSILKNVVVHSHKNCSGRQF